MKFTKSLTIFLSLFATVSGRVLIGQDPKTWTPQVANETVIVLSCDQCKTLVEFVENADVCKVLPDELKDACEAILPAIEQKYTPEVVCECLHICEASKWWTIKHNFHF